MPPSRLLVTGAVLGALTLLAGCAPQVTLADPGQPQVLEERNRIIRLLSTDLGDHRTPGVCQVKVLRHEGQTTWAFATCSMAAKDPASPRPRWADFLRVDGDRVRYAQGGAAYEESLRVLFPKDLADWALAHPTGR